MRPLRFLALVAVPALWYVLVRFVMQWTMPSWFIWFTALLAVAAALWLVVGLWAPSRFPAAVGASPSTGRTLLAVGTAITGAVVVTAKVFHLAGDPPICLSNNAFVQTVIAAIKSEPIDPSNYPQPDDATHLALRNHFITSVTPVGDPPGRAEDHSRYVTKTLMLPDTVTGRLQMGPRATVNPVEYSNRYRPNDLKKGCWTVRVDVDSTFVNPLTGRPVYEDPNAPDGALRLNAGRSYGFLVFVPRSDLPRGQPDSVYNPCYRRRDNSRTPVPIGQCKYQGVLWAVLVPDDTAKQVTYAHTYTYKLKADNNQARALFEEESPDCTCYTCDMHVWCRNCTPG